MTEYNGDNYITMQYAVHYEYTSYTFIDDRNTVNILLKAPGGIAFFAKGSVY